MKQPWLRKVQLDSKALTHAREYFANLRTLHIPLGRTASLGPARGAAAATAPLAPHRAAWPTAPSSKRRQRTAAAAWAAGMAAGQQ